MTEEGTDRVEMGEGGQIQQDDQAPEEAQCVYMYTSGGFGGAHLRSKFLLSVAVATISYSTDVV